MAILSVNLESITFMLKVKIIMFLGKSYIIAKFYLETNRNTDIYKLYASYAYEINVKKWYLIIPKGTKFTGSGKLGLRAQ